MSVGDINKLFHINILQALTYPPPYKIPFISTSGLLFLFFCFSLSFAYNGRFCEFKNLNVGNLRHK